MLSLHVQRATWIAGAILAALLFFLGGFAVRLLMGPISLGPFAGAIEDFINRSVSGLVVRFDKAVLEWSRTDGKVNLIVLGTKVFDLDGRIIAQAPKADIDFDAGFLIGGPLSVKRFSLIGVQVTGVRSKEGAIHLGFNSEQGAPDILETIRNILRSSAQGSGSLQSFAIRDARMAFSDEASGLFVVSPDTTFTLEDSAGRLKASFDSAVEISGVPARIAFRATLRDNGTPEQGTLEVHGLSVSALAENSTSFAALRPYRLISDLGGTFALSETGDLASAAFHVSGAGTVASPALETPLALDHFNIQGRYTKEGNRLALDAIEIGGKQISAKAKASIALVWNGTSLATASGDISAEQVKLMLPNWTNGPIALSRASFKGAYDAAAHRLSWERGSIRDGPLVADLSGSLVFARGGSPALKLSGSIDDIPIRDLLHYWPASVAQGAYLWIDENIRDGRIGPVKITANFPVGTLDSETLPDEVLSLSFPFAGTTIRYMDALTPVAGARGQALLTGNTFHATVVQGNVGPLAVKNGDVLLRDIHVRGAPGRVKVRTEGKLQDTLLLIDHAPLGYPSRFGVNPASTSGQAVVDLDFVIPLRRDVAIEEIGIGVQAKLVDVSLPLDQRFKLEHSTLSMDIDANSLIAQGSGLVSGVPATFSWSESFASLGDSTRIDVAAVLDDKSRPLLGLTQPDWVKGVMPFTASLWGRRFHFTDAAVKANATNASVDFTLVNLQKRSGVPASVSAFLHFADDDAISVSGLAVDGEGFKVSGGLEFDSSGTLTKAAFSRILAEPNNDFALNLDTMADGGLDLRVEAKTLDARRLFGDAMSGSGKKGASAVPTPAPSNSDLHEPLSLKVKLDTLSLRDNFSVHDVSLDVSLAANERLDSFTLDAIGPMNGKITGRLLDMNGARIVTLNVDDAGSFIKGIVGFASIQGGSLDAHVSLPNAVPSPNSSKAAPKPNLYAGVVSLSNIVVTDQAFMARLLAAGSQDGPQRLLRGGGIPVAHFNAPFTAHDKIVTIRDGRFSGTALGATFEGTLDRETDRVDIAGTLVPIYGLNSVLGSVPLLGDLFVSKPGEGIFGLTYAMRGDLNEPTLSVNPLSVLTPGIFRRIFEFSTPKDAPQASVGAAAKAE